MEEEATPSKEPKREPLANRNPWFYAVVSGLLVSALWAGIVALFHAQQPLPIGRSASLGEFRYTLETFDCELPTRPSKNQQCVAHIAIRNEGNRAARPEVIHTLFVGEQQYEGDAPIGEEVFPGRAISHRVSFNTPPHVAPTRLVISPYASVSDLLPIWQTEIAYDIP